MNYSVFALSGFTILFIIYLYYFNLNLKENNYIIAGSILLVLGFFNAVIEQYRKVYNKKQQNIYLSHLILAIFRITSYILPINKNIKNTDIFPLVGHIILINPNVDYQGIGYVALSIHYTFFTYRNGMKIDFIDKTQAIAGALLLIYFIKNSIDKIYIEREKEYFSNKNKLNKK